MYCFRYYGGGYAPHSYNQYMNNYPEPQEENDLKKTNDVSSDNNEFASAFIGPNLWNSNRNGDTDCKHQYMDFYEFLSENGISSNAPDKLDECNKGQITKEQTRMVPKTRTTYELQNNSFAVTSEINDEMRFEVQETEQALIAHPGDDDFDPKNRSFSEEELRPQPIIRKSRKFFVPEDNKDEKYWKMRRKNNVAAKRSREARRTKENQIAMRAAFLEKENSILNEELNMMKKENKKLKEAILCYGKNEK